LTKINTDTDSDEEQNDSQLQDPEDDNIVDDDYEGADWWEKLPTDWAPLHEFLGEQNGLNKLAATNITDDSKTGDYFILFFSADSAHCFVGDEPLHGASIHCKGQNSSSNTRNIYERFASIFGSCYSDGS
jgi:hypothetical protein